MARPEACEGRSGRKDTDATRRLVAKRLAWLAKDSNWDGTLRPPPPKLLPPPSSGLKSSMACTGRRAICGTSPCVEQAPGWDGQVTGITRWTTPDKDKRMGATTRKPGQGSPRRGQYKNKGPRWASKVVSTLQNDVVSEEPTAESENHVADTTPSHEQITDTSLSVRPFKGGNWPATHDCKFWYAGDEENQDQDHDQEEEGEEGGGGTDFGGDEQDRDTAAGYDDCNGANSVDNVGDGGLASGAANRATSDGSDLKGFTPKTNDTDDTDSELSCSGIFTTSSEVGDEQENQDQGSGSDESTHDSSSESPNPTQVATHDSDDIGASHVEHLIHERRRWKLRAIESEHELAGFQSLHARKSGIDGRAMESRSAEAMMVRALGSLGESIASETSVVESGFDPNDRWPAESGNEGAPSASSCSTPSMGRARKQRGFSDTTSEAQFSEAASATSDCIPARGRRYDIAAGLGHNRRNRLLDDKDVRGGQGMNGDTRQHIEGTCGDDCHALLSGDGKQGHNGTRTHRLLQEEIAELRDNLRKAELRHVAAEATAASVLQRARAAELSRDVKEIQIRNLEIRLARYTNTNKHQRENCARWKERQPLSENESPDGDIQLDLFRPRMEPPLSTVVEEGEELLMMPSERIRNDRGRSSSTVENCGPNSAVCDARTENVVSGLAVGGRAALDRFRHGCFMLGAKAARAGGGAMSAAAAVASEATKEAVHSATVTVGGGGRRDAAGDQFSQGEVDGGIVEEYWGSDYCTSV